MSNLRGFIGTTDTTIQVDDTTSLPVNGGVVQIESEKILYTTATDKSLLGCTRGALSTSAATHADKKPLTNLSSVPFESGVLDFHDAGNPTNAITGKGIAKIGDRFTNTTNGAIFTNTGTIDAPIWTLLETGAGSSPAGTTGDVQYNSGGVFAADSGNLSYNPSTQTLNVSGAIVTGSADVNNVKFEGSTSHITLEAVTVPSPYLLKLPDAQGTGALTNDGSGNLSWQAGGGGGSGALLQRASISTTTSNTTTSNSYVDTDLTIAYTATGAGHDMELIVSGVLYLSTGGDVIRVTIAKDGTNVVGAGLLEYSAAAGGTILPFSYTFPSVTSAGAHTYTVRILSTGSHSVQLGTGDVTTNTLVIKEYNL